MLRVKPDQTQALRVVRGGAWNNETARLRVSARNRNGTANRNDNQGFRLAQADPGSNTG